MQREIVDRNAYVYGDTWRKRDSYDYTDFRRVRRGSYSDRSIDSYYNRPRRYSDGDMYPVAYRRSYGRPHAVEVIRTRRNSGM